MNKKLDWIHGIETIQSGNSYVAFFQGKTATVKRNRLKNELENHFLAAQAVTKLWKNLKIEIEKTAIETREGYVFPIR